ncbi:pol [Symbiodinium sp. CCMP2592]|nr:pol [Symbiodinium sp. CCMP2592]
MHSSGYTCSPPDKSSGVLVMLSKKHFEDAAVHEPVPGRVLQVRATVKTSKLPLTVVGVYQHVWRTHLSTVQNLELRRGVCHAVSTIGQQTPQRHHLIIAGDINAKLTPQHPHVGGAGAATRSPAANHSPELQQLLAEGDLCALNTWHTPHRDTYVTPTRNSQIDFVVVRCAEAKGKAKHCAPLVQFPVAGWRQAGHRPLHAELWLRPFRRQETAQLPAQHRCQVDVLQQAVADQTETAQAMQTHVEARVQQLLQQSSPNASCLQASLNLILWDAAERSFPVNLSGHLLSHLAKMALASAVSKSLPGSSATKPEQQIQEAEEAAARHDQRTLYQIIKRMAPKSYKTASRLLGPDGRLMTPSGELQVILQHGKQTFAALMDVEHLLVPHEPLHISEQSLQDELRALKLRKAVPAHIAPAAVWKQCYACLGSCLARALNDHFALPAQQPLQHDWKDCYSNSPIGLQCPTTKAFAGALRERLLQVLHPALASLPQFAYIKQRGTQEALLRVHMHFHHVVCMLKDNIVDRFQQKAGKKAAKCIGAMSLSLDLSRAFDSASRPEVYQTMLHHGVPKEVVNAVQQLHLHALYKYQVGQNSHGATSTTNGVKQGCKIAPYLWCFLTLRFMELLMQSRSEQWLVHIMTIFADDVWSNWIIRSLADFRQAKADLELILTVLESLHLTVNYKKTAILLILEGKEAVKILRDHTTTKAGQHLLRLTDSPLDSIVQTSAHYSLTAVGVTRKGLDKLTKAPTKQLRAGHPLPAQQLVQSLVLQYAEEQLRQLQLLASASLREERTADDAPVQTVACPECGCRHTQSAPLPLMQWLTQWEASAVSATAASEMPPATSSDSRTLPVENIPEDQFSECAQLGLLALAAGISSNYGGERRGRHLPLLFSQRSSSYEHPDNSDAIRCGDTGTVTGTASGPIEIQATEEQKMMAITKLLLQHEDRINCLSLDRGLVMFLKEDTHSVLPAMMRAAKEWNARKDQGDDRLVSPLRTVLLANLIKELQQRLQHVVATQEGRESLRKAKWLAENGDWYYMKWCRKTKTLIPKEDKTPLQHTEAVRVLSFLYENLKYDIIQNFKSTQKLQHREDQNRTSATFLVDISLRGSLAQEVYEHFEN